MPIVYVFGNPELQSDSLPLRILDALRARRPDIDFQVLDPNENWPEIETICAIDTVVGIKDATVFDDLEEFEAAPTLTMHDFDALAQMRLLKKLGKLKDVRLIGLPADLPEETAVTATIKSLELINLH